MPSCIAEEPFSPHLYANITPEESVRGLTFGLADNSSAASPNVSSNSSWASDANRPSSIYRYAHNHERHEELAISLSAVPEAGYQWTVGTAAADDKHPFTKLPDAAARSLAHSDAPLHRYMANIQAHEFLAFALESSSQDQPTQQHPLPSPKHTKETRSPLLMLNASGVDAIEDGEDNDVTEETTLLKLYVCQNPFRKHVLTFALRSHQRQREQGHGQPRRLKDPRKRSAVSAQPGHKDKMARWS